MPDNAPQSYVSHTRLDPPFHFFVLPVLLITILLVIWNLIKNFSLDTIWVVIVALALLVLAFKARLYALKAQDRVIRLEERLRLSSLLSEPLRSRIGELTEGQLIAIRFASDAELPALAQKTLDGKLAPADIKKAIVNWRPDNFRI
jgi:hypothetical protein